MSKSRLSYEVKYLKRTDEDRPWLPGSPPSRQTDHVDQAEDDDASRIHDLNIPFRRIFFPHQGADTAKVMRSALKDLQFSREHNKRYLYHGCGTNINLATMQSFSRIGPSIKFSRRRSYLSAHPAVYWTDSIEFAMAWCVFTRTGNWNLDCITEHSGFECIIYVTELDFDALSTTLRTYEIPPAQSEADEQALVDWCLANAYEGDEDDALRLPPPGTTIRDWDVLISRIPQHTVDGLIAAGVVASELDCREDNGMLDARLYAACGATNSRIFASAGVEVLHVSMK